VCVRVCVRVRAVLCCGFVARCPLGFPPPSLLARPHRPRGMARTDRRWLLLVVAATAVCDASRLGPTQQLRPRAMPKRALRQEAAPEPSSVLRLRGGAAAMNKAQGWSVLFAATVFELVSTIYMDKAEGFSKLLPSVIACAFYAASFYGFNLSLRALETSIAYAVWSAVVMAALSVVGIVFLNESKSWLKFTGVTTIIFGTVCLSLADGQK